MTFTVVPEARPTELPGEGTRAYLDAALCADGTGDLTELFFSDALDDVGAAMLICAGCALIEPCLVGALDRGERSGVWGGQLLVGGRIATIKRRRGRPPRVARPGDALPQVPLPDAIAERAEREGLFATLR